MKTLTIFICLFLSINFSRCGEIKPKTIYLTSSYQESNNYESIEIDSIITKGVSDNKRITIKGFLTSRWEDRAVYASSNDAKKYNYTKAVWFSIDSDTSIVNILKEYNKRDKIIFVKVDGILNFDMKGHMGQYIGEIMVERVVIN